MPPRTPGLDQIQPIVTELGELGDSMTDADVDLLMERVPQLFRRLCLDAGNDSTRITAIIAKFRDAGRRTPPLQAASSIVPGRAQNAADGNRTNRWEVPSDHRFYATKRDAQLVEIRYFLQALSMSGAPPLRSARASAAFIWLLGHEIVPGAYKDPIMLRDIDFAAFVASPRRVQSGHYVPLARDGHHTAENTFLMLSRSNSMQSDLTFDELLALIADILGRQAADGIHPNPSKVPAHALLEEVSGIVAE